MTGSDSTMRLGTMNVRSLGGRLGGVLDFAQLQNLHVLCLQETRVNNHSWNAVTRAVKARGWQLFPGPQGRNSKNVVEGGTLVLTKWPAEALALPVDMVSVERSMAVKLYRPQKAVDSHQCLLTCFRSHSCQPCAGCAVRVCCCLW